MTCGADDANGGGPAWWIDWCCAKYATSAVGENRDGPVALCSMLPRRTCLIDGDTGRDNGKTWRLIAIDTPERGKDDPHGRALVDIELPDGRDVSRILLKEGLAQPWPNRGNMWCDRYTGTPARPRG